MSSGGARWARSGLELFWRGIGDPVERHVGDMDFVVSRCFARDKGGDGAMDRAAAHLELIRMARRAEFDFVTGRNPGPGNHELITLLTNFHHHTHQTKITHPAF